MKVCFYTNGHLGDFIISIPFLKLLIEKYPENEYYQYSRGSDRTVFPDIFIRAVPGLKLSTDICGDINIPTWFCDNEYTHLHKTGEEALQLLYPYDLVTIQKYFWTYIFNKHNFNIEIPEDIGLDFDFENILSKEVINSINQIAKSHRKKIFFVNVIGRSGQTDNEHWIPKIKKLSNLYADCDFYYTNNEVFKIKETNIIHTPTIFGEHSSDIIHNAYLSLFCDIIVAKNSGAFQAISMQTKNVSQEKKIFITQTKDNEHKPDLECFYNRSLYKATNFHTNTTEQTFKKLKQILELCQ